MFHNNIMIISESLNNRNLFKICIQSTHPIEFCIFCSHFYYGKNKTYLSFSSPEPITSRPPVCRLTTPLNDFASETAGPIFFKLLVESSCKGGLKNYTSALGTLNTMAAMSIYDKNKQNKKKLKSSSPEPRISML